MKCIFLLFLSYAALLVAGQRSDRVIVIGDEGSGDGDENIKIDSGFESIAAGSGSRNTYIDAGFGSGDGEDVTTVSPAMAIILKSRN